MRNYDVFVTPAGEVRVSPIEAMILQNSYGPIGIGFPPTAKAVAIAEACQRVAEWRNHHDA